MDYGKYRVKRRLRIISHASLYPIGLLALASFLPMNERALAAIFWISFISTLTGLASVLRLFWLDFKH